MTLILLFPLCPLLQSNPGVLHRHAGGRGEGDAGLPERERRVRNGPSKIHEL